MENGSKQYLTFRVARNDLALDASRVRAILPMEVLIPLKSSRPGVIGAVSFSGHSAVVVDLRERLNLAQASKGARPRVVVVEAAGGHLAGFLVDRVTDVIRYRSRDLRDGILRGVGRARRVVEIDQVVEEDDLVRLWSVSL